MKNKYSELSDFEINAHVAEKMDFHKYIINYSDNPSYNYVRVNDRTFDSCNNPSDAMPIIIENKISLVYVNNYWSARQFHNACIEINDENPLRAAMIVFLMMRDEKK
ncbi:hypothetical protein B5C26_00050 [Photorhabdus luminescens]|uniref:DUF2591 domain-containing protein n=1 Tax=Photorhabdus luminescens TaxID=29488 RepID=UPI000B4CE1B5|nr:DUF2591 domain-containing protein [Photorhabdus luminescens]OWO87209.1 hypothetical protein B5C26_00050 [Photorhabdus luminescens]